jgi:phosphatidylglycerophosphatase A
MSDQTPTPLTDFSRRTSAARALIAALLTERLGPVALEYDFFREWNGCWKARVDLRGGAGGQLEFTLLQTPGGGLLALPRPLPEAWRLTTGVPADDGTRWTLDDEGLLVPFPPPTPGAAPAPGGATVAGGPIQPGAGAPPRSTRDRLILFLAQGFGTGRSPRAPGTFGTLPGVLLYLPLSMLPLGAYLAVTVALLLIGIPLCDRAARLLGREDPPSVVWDEIVGMLISMTAVPPSWPAVALGFAAFRFFDIWKPWPIRPLDRGVKGGLGIMLDDCVAGLMALALVHLGLFLMPAGGGL